MSLHKIRCIGSNIALNRLKLAFILMNIHKHGVPHSAKGISGNIW